MMPSGTAHRLNVLAVKSWAVMSLVPVTQELLTPNGHNLRWPHLTLLTFSALIQHLSPPACPVPGGTALSPAYPPLLPSCTSCSVRPSEVWHSYC